MLEEKTVTCLVCCKRVIKLKPALKKGKGLKMIYSIKHQTLWLFFHGFFRNTS